MPRKRAICLRHEVLQAEINEPSPPYDPTCEPPYEEPPYDDDDAQTQVINGRHPRGVG